MAIALYLMYVVKWKVYHVAILGKPHADLDIGIKKLYTFTCKSR